MARSKRVNCGWYSRPKNFRKTIRINKMTKYLLIGVAVLVGIFAWYYKDSQNRLKLLMENNAKLEVANETNQKTINTMQEDTKKFTELNTRLQKDLQEAESYTDDLRKKLNNHNLTQLSKQNPSAIEKRINDATKKLFEDIEKDTSIK
jgi:predicted nuclease with TOPRIM domain